MKGALVHVGSARSSVMCFASRYLGKTFGDSMADIRRATAGPLTTAAPVLPTIGSEVFQALNRLNFCETDAVARYARASPTGAMRNPGSSLPKDVKEITL